MSEYRVASAIAPVLASPSTDAVCTSEALHGELVSAIDYHGDWIEAKQQHDGYIGYIHLRDLDAIEPTSGSELGNTHWVVQRSTLLFKTPDLKSPVVRRIPFASELLLEPIHNSPFSKTICNSFVWSDHCLPINVNHPLDPLTLAQSYFLGMPYRWGGRSPEGADCSGLIQLLARSQGLAIPRDSGDQELFIEQQIDKGNYKANDIVYWPGHTGILLDENMLLHSTAFTLSCIVEPLYDVQGRAGAISSVRRLFR